MCIRDSFYTYFSLHFTTLEGANSTLLGLCFTISSIAEVPFLLLSNKLYERFGAGKLLITAGISVTIRWLLLGSLTNVYAVMATQLFHGWGFIVMTVTMAYYVNDLSLIHICITLIVRIIFCPCYAASAWIRP